MKKSIFVVFIFMFLTTCVSAQEQKNEQIFAEKVNYTIKVDGLVKSFLNPIVTIDDRTYIPLRELSELLGYDVEWNEETQTIEIETDTQKEAETTNYDEQKNTGEEWLIFIENNKYGYMDKYGNIKIPAQFDWAKDFVDGVAIVGNDVENWRDIPTDSGISFYDCGVVNVDGELVVPIKYSYIWDFNEGLALAKEDDDSEPYYIDKEGNKSSQKVIGNKFFTKGVSPKLLRGGSAYPIPDPPPEVWSYIDSNGIQATDNEYEYAEDFYDGYAIVKNNGKYGIIDTDFNVVVDYKYDSLRKIDDILYDAVKGGKHGVIDTNDNTVIDFDYWRIGRKFSEGLLPVFLEKDNAAYVDKNGKIRFKSKFSDVDIFVGGYACVKDKATGKYGVIDSEGNYIITPEYYYLLPSQSGIFKAYDQAGKDYYYINIKGEKIIPHS